jgi:hypothetical protein
LGSLALSSRSVAAASVCAALSWIASVPMGEAVRFRQAQRKTRLGMAFVGSWVLLTALSSAGGGDASDNPPYAVAACAAGAVSIVASMKILWKFRYVLQSSPNPLSASNTAPSWLPLACVCGPSVLHPSCLLYFYYAAKWVTRGSSRASPILIRSSTIWEDPCCKCTMSLFSWMRCACLHNTHSALFDTTASGVGFSFGSVWPPPTRLTPVR